MVKNRMIADQERVLRVLPVVIALAAPLSALAQSLPNEPGANAAAVQIAGAVPGQVGTSAVSNSSDAAVNPGELELLKRMLQEVISENKALTKRVHELDTEMTKAKAATARQEQAARDVAQLSEPEPEVTKTKAAAARPERATEILAAEQTTVPSVTPVVDAPNRARAPTREQQQLERRVEELEKAQTAQEDATRAIIRDSVSTLGSKVNEFVALGGTLEILGGWAEAFDGRSDRVLELNTAELDFEIQVNDWTLGSLIVGYEDGTGTVFPTTEGGEASVDRIILDRAFITIGDPQRIPPFLKAGRQVVPFGISTGAPVGDVPTIVDPLTIEVFETKQDSILFGVEFPTPAPTPPTPPVSPPRVKPQVINPLVSSLSEWLGYVPPPTPPPMPTFITPPPQPPPVTAGVYLYNGTTHDNNLGATLGYRTRGHCGRSYEQLAGGGWLQSFCPWSVDIDVDYNSSVFDSLLLEREYQAFLNQIGTVGGMAASVKTNLGPVGLIGEWNGAIDRAKFSDDSGTAVNIKPSAWQVSMVYQFDWNPWVDVIGGQGTYLTFGYSESQDLAGVTREVNAESTRVGAVPKRRFLLGVGEWVLDGLRIALEYSYNKDYSVSEGGTGKSSHAVFSLMTYEW